MRFVVRLVPLICLAAGCSLAHKPYADDPLLRGGRAVWHSRDEIPPGLPVETPAVVEAPQPPPSPTYRKWE